MKLKDYISEGELDGFKAWLRMEIAKQVAETDVRHLVFTTFDSGLAAGVKNAVIRHIFNNWEIKHD